MSEAINVTLRLEQLEVVADALEFMGECIEEEIDDTAEGSAERQSLLTDLEEITTIMEIIAESMDCLIDGTQK